MFGKTVSTTLTILMFIISTGIVATLAEAGYAKVNDLGASEGVDIFRGAWGGTLAAPGDVTYQINLYFTESVPIESESLSFKASGYFSLDELGGPKRAKASQLPMMAKIKYLSERTCELLIYANLFVPVNGGQQGVIILRLDGKAQFGGHSVNDDTMEGKWSLRGPGDYVLEGPWSATHLDRRHVEMPEIVPQYPLYFSGDLKVHLFGPGAPNPIENRNPIYAFDVMSNIVMDNVRVTFPDGRSVILQPYTDVFSPGVDWLTQFRFILNLEGLPTQGKPYTFAALDVAGNPITGLVTYDVWVGVNPPDPPTNVQAQTTGGGIQVSWNPVNPVSGSFEPGVGIGWYQMEVWSIDGTEVYGANQIHTTTHLIPKERADFIQGQDWGLSLSEMGDGTYEFDVNVHSLAPADSAGHGIEYSSRDPTEIVVFTIKEGIIEVIS
jgi:hypothetical protein